jgi:hypothetical protein
MHEPSRRGGSNAQAHEPSRILVKKFVSSAGAVNRKIKESTVPDYPAILGKCLRRVARVVQDAIRDHQIGDFPAQWQAPVVAHNSGQPMALCDHRNRLRAAIQPNASQSAMPKIRQYAARTAANVEHQGFPWQRVNHFQQKR